MKSQLKKINFLYYVLVLFISLYTGGVFALSDLYSVVVNIKDYSETEKANALLQGFQQVLQNVSANPNVINDKKIKKSFTDVDQFVNKFSYQKTPALAIAMQFDADKINTLIKSANISILQPASAVKPNIIAWVAIKDDLDIEPKILGDNNFLEYETLLTTKAKKSGLALLLPLLDLEDTEEVSANDLTNKDLAKISHNAIKYNANVILLGNASRSHDGWNFNWTLHKDGKDIFWISTNHSWNNELDSVIQKLSANTQNAKEIPVDSAVIKNDALNILKIRVSGITSLEKLNVVENYLTKLIGGDKIELLELDADRALFNLKINSTKDNLLNSLKLDRFLIQSLNTSNEVVDVIDFKVES